MSDIEISSVTLKMLLDAGILKAGTRLYAESDNSVVANLEPDGNIRLNIDNEVVVKQSLSGAARALTGKSINGWLFWSVSESGALRTLSSFRYKYK